MPRITPESRYATLNQMLSGVRLSASRPKNSTGEFFSQTSKPFCGFWDGDEIAQTFLETGCFEHWKAQGYTRIWITLDDPVGQNRYGLNVWTQVGEYSELLMQLVVWLEYLEIETHGVSYPSFYVEHLRLQSPGKSFVQPVLPGQEFPRSGLLRRIFGLIKNWACVCGAQVISEIPEYFHTAYLFREYFHFADREMEGLFRAIQRDLGAHSFGEISAAFEAGRVRYEGNPWLWPTELQVYGLSHDLQDRFRVPEGIIDSGHFEMTE